VKVRITKSGRWADKAPSDPIVTVIEGEVMDNLSDHLCNRLIETGCAVAIEGDVTEDTEIEPSEPVKEDKPETLEETLDRIANEAGGFSGGRKAKAALEAYAKNNFGIDIDRRMGADKIKAVILEAAKGSDS
jgi:hypothetical protein